MVLFSRQFFGACIALSGQVAWAEALTEQEYFQDFPIVLSASRLAQPQSEAPNAMTVIDRKMIEESGFRSIPDLFKLVPGMYVGYYKGNTPFVSYHGSPDQYARRMQVMIDGRSVYMPPMSMVDWTSLPIVVDDIERIEVIRGPAAASHGANSTQGVISIITRDAATLSGKRVSVTRGEKGINEASAQFGRRNGTFDYRMTMAYSADNGFDNLSATPTSVPATVNGSAGLINNTYDSNQARLLNYRAGYHPNGVDSFDLQFGFNHDIKNVGWTDSAGNPVHDLIGNSNFVQLGWVRALEDAAELKLSYYHIRHDLHERFSVIYFPQMVVQSVNSSRDEIEVQHTLTLPASNRLVYGAAYRKDSVDGQYSDLSPIAPAYSSSLNTEEWRLFAHDEWRITPRLLLNTGGMFERDGFGNENFSPRVALNFHAMPKHTFRIGASVAYRTPALMERYGPMIQLGELWVVSATPASPNLRPEKLVSREIGYLGDFQGWGTSVDFRLFSDLLSNGIFPSATFINGLSVEYRGFEATLKHSFNEDSDLTINFARELARSNGPAMTMAGFAGLASVCASNIDIVSCSIPKNTVSMLYSQRFSSGVALSATNYFQGRMQPFDRGPVDFQPVQHRTDIRLAKEFQEIGGLKGDLALVVQNLFDQTYTDYVANNLNNRRTILTATLKF